MMAQSFSSSPHRVRSVGDYEVGKQLGSGSFSVVWHAKHKIHGTQVAIKEILLGKMNNKKLEESLMSEIDILKNINHPNIIRLLDMIKVILALLGMIVTLGYGVCWMMKIYLVGDR